MQHSSGLLSGARPKELREAVSNLGCSPLIGISPLCPSLAGFPRDLGRLIFVDLCSAAICNEPGLDWRLIGNMLQGVKVRPVPAG